jgi:outer membrane protein
MKSAILYLSALLALLSVSVSAQDSIKILQLDDCIKLGLSQSTQILRSEDSLQITGAQLIGSYGQFLPNLSFSGNYGYITGSNLLTVTEPTLVNSKVNQLTYQLTSTINIFNGFSDYSALKTAMLSKSAAQFNLDRAKQQIAFDITQTYLQIILDRHIVEYAKENLNASTTRETQLQELTNVGRKSVADLYQQQAETSNDKLFQIQSEDKLKNDIILLLRKLKISQTDKYKIGDFVLDSLPLGPQYNDVQNLIDSATKQRADLKSAGLAVTINQWEIKNYQSGYLPKLWLEGGLISNGGYFDQLYVNGIDELGQQEPVSKALFGQLYGQVALSLTWNIFDRFYTRTNVSIAKINQRNAQIQYDDLSVQISSEIKQAYNDYISALQQIETADRGLVSALQAFEVISGEYNIGKASFVDLSNAQAVLLQTQVSKAQSDVNLSLQKKIIDYYIGK